MAEVPAQPPSANRAKAGRQAVSSFFMTNYMRSEKADSKVTAEMMEAA